LGRGLPGPRIHQPGFTVDECVVSRFPAKNGTAPRGGVDPFGRAVANYPDG